MTAARTLLAALAVLCATTAAAQAPALEWYETYADARRAAAEQKKPLLLDFYAEWCVWCRIMDRDTFRDPRVQKLLENYVCVRIDTELEPRVAFAFQVRTLPRIVIANVHGEIVADSMGFHDPERMEALLNDVGPNLSTKGDRELLPAVDEERTAESPTVLAAERYGDDVVAALGDPEPRVREAALAELAKRGSAAVPDLAAALASDQMGVRVGAWDALQQMGKALHPFDPWAKREERIKSLEPWRQWLSAELEKELSPEELQRHADAVLQAYAASSAQPPSNPSDIQFEEVDSDGNGSPDGFRATRTLAPRRQLVLLFTLENGTPNLKEHRIEIPRAQVP